MPAIEYSRLRTKIELLGRVYDQPGQFVKDLSDLYFFYSDLTFQSSSTSVLSSASPAYKAPVVINRELERLLKSKAQSMPEQTLNIIDQLWQTKTLEPCQLAAALLGSLPRDHSQAVLERISRWSQAGTSPDLLQILHTKGSAAIRRDQPELWLSTLRSWYQGKEVFMQKMAILGLQPLLDDPDFTNLPLIFDFLEPIVEKTDPHLAFTLLSIIEQLVRKSESETVFFLKQIIKGSNSEDLPRFIRRAIPSFSESGQQSLKTCLRENKNA